MDSPTDIPISETKIEDAFHGTGELVAMAIEKSGFKINSFRKSYCGQGIYFWEGSEERAVTWARKRGHGRIGVIKSKIELRKCLNLCIPECRSMLRNFYLDLKKRRDLTIDPPTAISMLAGKTTADTVVYAQVKPRQALFDEPPYVDDVSIIICVRNLECIKTAVCTYKGL